MSEIESYELSDGEIDDTKHTKLVHNILNLNKIQNLKKPSRTEPTLQVSEFNLVKSVTGNKGSVHLNELTKVLKGRKKEDILKKVQSTSKKSNTLPTPLEKPQADRIRRSVNYEKSRLQLDRWEALVTANRAASHLTFPLNSIEKVKFEDKKAEKYPSTWRLKSALQKELEKLEPKVEEHHINTEDREQFPLTIEELAEQRIEAAKLRAHQSYKEAKARRQNKIKSKKYHRILRREKIKKTLKEFEELQKTDPEGALKKLEEIEKVRSIERFSLRHKGTGKWAKTKQIRAKYDKESRQELAQQLAVSRELTQKIKSIGSDSEEEGIQSEENSKPLKVYDDNPWLAGIKPDKEVSDFIKSYRVYWDEHNKEQQNNMNVQTNEASKTVNPVEGVHKAAAKDDTVALVNKMISKVKRNSKKSKRVLKKKRNNIKPQVDSSVGTSEWEVTALDKYNEENDIDDIFDDLETKLTQKAKHKCDRIKRNNIKNSAQTKTRKQTNKKKKSVDLSVPLKSKKIVIDEELVEIPGHVGNVNENNVDEVNPDLNTLKTILSTVGQEQGITKGKSASDIDPDKFVQVKKTSLNTAIPDILVTDENEENNSQRDVILEAFEDDDICDDFAKEKADEIEKDTPKDIDLNLPGWGSWAGANINPSKRKRKRFIVKMPPKMPRKDDNKGSLIINEKAQSKIKPHMVSEVPFPFKTVRDYEASIRAPIGNTFVPETAFKRLIEPVVSTKMGTIIEPITKSVLIGTKVS